MLSRKLYLSAGMIVLCASSSAYAFHNVGTTKASTTHNFYHQASDALESNAKSFVRDLTKEGIGFLENEEATDEDRKASFRKLLEKNFDMKTIGRFALGRYWKTSSKSEQKEYLNLFEDMIVEVYSRRFSDYNGQIIEITNAQMNGKDVLVTSQIVPKSGPNIQVDWRVRKKKNGTMKVVDIIVEGVSMSLTQRSDFASVIQRGGGKIEALLEHLRPKKS